MILREKNSFYKMVGEKNSYRKLISTWELVMQAGT